MYTEKISFTSFIGKENALSIPLMLFINSKFKEEGHKTDQQNIKINEINEKYLDIEFKCLNTKCCYGFKIMKGFGFNEAFISKINLLIKLSYKKKEALESSLYYALTSCRITQRVQIDESHSINELDKLIKSLNIM